ncbi:MAG: hypothetical protein JSV88_19955 [Candidatus Aminicenantes bacterium]|nr:MAG: hypothetical protein JSV88_19955 [Candidatus Aminicenantes bacterium]
MSNDPIEYIEGKSKEILKGQIESYRILHSRAGIVIGLLTLLISIFLFIIEKTNTIIQIISIIPILLLIYGIYQMLQVMKSVALFRGYNEKKFEEFINYDIKYLKKYEIAANKLAIQMNDKILRNQNNMYNRWITSIIFSFIVLIILVVIFIYVY